MHKRLKDLLLVLIFFSPVWVWAQGKEISEWTWNFPLNRPFAGIPVGNGTQGILVWGKENQLHLTIGHAGFWDRRGGRTISSTTYNEVLSAFEKGDEQTCRELLNSKERRDGFQQLPAGRISLTFPKGYVVEKGVLDKASGLVKITLRSNKGQPMWCAIAQDKNQPTAGIKYAPALVGKVQVKVTPAYLLAKEAFVKRGISAPDTLDKERKGGKLLGFIQKLPSDNPLVLLALEKKDELLISSQVGQVPDNEAAALLDRVRFQSLADSSILFWGRYWESSPKVSLPDGLLQELHDYGLYMVASTFSKNGPAVSLQGCFMEDYQMPPWSNDFHWNINVQMAYQSLLKTGRYEYFEPLLAMLKSWMPEMQRAGEKFFGKEGAMLLPHATDDKGKLANTFWVGQIDPANLGWTAVILAEYAIAAGNKEDLRTAIKPFIEGSLVAYKAMAKTKINPANGREVVYFPMTTSPEYSGAQIYAVGKDASFHLAMVRRLIATLVEINKELQLPTPDEWLGWAEKIPAYSKAKVALNAEYPQFKHDVVALWDSIPLGASHRHHSHLAGIYPFEVLSPFDTIDGKLWEQTYTQWVRLGMGHWAGWSFPWAAQLHLKFGQPDAARSVLAFWNQNFVTEGRHTLHDAAHKGISLFRWGDGYREAEAGLPMREVMQLEARFGALNAVQDFLTMENKGVVEVFPFTPKFWKEASFQDVATKSGFRVSALMKKGKVVAIKLKASKAGEVKVKLPFPEGYYLNNEWQETSAGIIELKAFEAGEEFWLRAKGQDRKIPILEWTPKKRLSAKEVLNR